jgi:hypothetical protein
MGHMMSLREFHCHLPCRMNNEYGYNGYAAVGVKEHRNISCSTFTSTCKPCVKISYMKVHSTCQILQYRMCSFGHLLVGVGVRRVTNILARELVVAQPVIIMQIVTNEWGKYRRSNFQVKKQRLF